MSDTPSVDSVGTTNARSLSAAFRDLPFKTKAMLVIGVAGGAMVMAGVMTAGSQQSAQAMPAQTQSASPVVGVTTQPGAAPVATSGDQQAAQALSESVKANATNVAALLQQRYGLSATPQNVAEFCGAPTDNQNEWIRDCLLKIADMRLTIIKAQVEAEKRALGLIP